MKVKALMGIYAAVLTIVSLTMALYIKEMKIRIADRDIRIKRLSNWIASIDDAGLTNGQV